MYRTFFIFGKINARHFEKSEIKYLYGDLSTALIYRLYVTHCNENGQAPVKGSYYWKVFEEEFNLSFKNRKMTCEKCDKIKLQLEVEIDLEKKTRNRTERNKHEKLYESSYAEKKRECEFFDSRIQFIQATIKLWTLNLTIY